jgi:uncharacterized membrane protein YqjE
MSEREPAPGEGGAGAAGHAQAFIAACARYVSARFQLASIESREAAGHGLKLLALAAAAVVLATFGWFFLCLAGVFLLAMAIGGPHGWLWAALAMAGAHFLGVIVLALALKSKLATKLFPMTIAELQKDQEWMDRK